MVEESTIKRLGCLLCLLDVRTSFHPRRHSLFLNSILTMKCIRKQLVPPMQMHGVSLHELKYGTCPPIKMQNTFQEGSAIDRKARSCGISVVILLDGKQLCILTSHNITRCHCERIVTGDHKPDTWGLLPSCPASSSATWHLRNLIALCSHSRSRSQSQVLISCACKSVSHQTLPRDFIALRRHSC